MYKKELALNNLQGMLCHKTKQPNYIYSTNIYKENFGFKWPTMGDMP